MKLNILGTDYDFKYASDEDVAKEMCGQPGEFGGYCDGYNKSIVIGKCNLMLGDEVTKKTIQSESIRHEIIHAFMNESGLKGNSEWAHNEELVDWIALQFPKILKVYEKLGVL